MKKYLPYIVIAAVIGLVVVISQWSKWFPATQSIISNTKTFRCPPGTSPSYGPKGILCV